MPRADRRQEIMRAAEGLFTSRRYHEVTTDDIARAARVGKGTIYRYFEDKDDLFFQVATSGFDELCELLARRVPGDAPFREQLLSACGEIARFFRRRAQLLRMMQAEEGRLPWLKPRLRSRWAAHRKKLVSAVAAILRKGVEEGHVRADIPCEVLAHFLLGMLRTRGRQLAEAPAAMRSDAMIVDLFCHGVAPSGD
ncbi:MAG: TetR/AcrR family transcriptional regulator [bacterium]